jgi:hypothetical protein
MILTVFFLLLIINNFSNMISVKQIETHCFDVGIWIMALIIVL